MVTVFRNFARTVGLKSILGLIKTFMEDRYIEDAGRRCSTRITDYWIDLLRSSYTLVKKRLLENIGSIEDPLFIDVLNFDELLPVITATTDNDKIDCLLRTVIRKGDAVCEKLVNRLSDKQILQLNDLKELKTKNLPDNIFQEFDWLHPEIFRNHDVQQYMIREVEINDVIDILYEWHLIDIDEHESIQIPIDRTGKVVKMMSLLNTIADLNWFIKFCHILKTHDHERVVIWLRRKYSSSSTSEQETVDDLDISFGCNIKVTTTEETEITLQQHHINDMNNQLPDIGPVVDVRSGCVEFILLSSYDKLPKGRQQTFCLQFLQNLLRLTDVKATLKPGQSFKVMLRRCCLNIPLLDNSGQKVSSLNDDVALKLGRHEILQQMNASETLGCLKEMGLTNSETSENVQHIVDEKIKKEYIFHILASFDNTGLVVFLQKLKESKDCQCISDCVEAKKCLECFRYSVWQSRKIVMDEIDTEMMKMTFSDRHQQVPKFIFEFCVEKANTISRTDRAKLFLDFVLIKGQLLVQFAKVLTSRSKLVMPHVKCDICEKGASGGTFEDREEDKAEFEFIINEKGELVIRNQTFQSIKQTYTEASGSKLKALERPQLKRKEISSVEEQLEEALQESSKQFKEFMTKTTDKSEIIAFTDILLSEIDARHTCKLEPDQQAKELYLSTVIEQQNRIRRLEEKIHEIE